MTLLEFFRTAEPDAIALEILRLQMTAIEVHRERGKGWLHFEVAALIATIKSLQEEHEPGLDSEIFQLALLIAKRMIQKKEEMGL